MAPIDYSFPVTPSAACNKFIQSSLPRKHSWKMHVSGVFWTSDISWFSSCSWSSSAASGSSVQYEQSWWEVVWCGSHGVDQGCCAGLHRVIQRTPHLVKYKAPPKQRQKFERNCICQNSREFEKRFDNRTFQQIKKKIHILRSHSSVLFQR